MVLRRNDQGNWFGSSGLCIVFKKKWFKAVLFKNGVQRMDCFCLLFWHGTNKDRFFWFWLLILHGSNKNWFCWFLSLVLRRNGQGNWFFWFLLLVLNGIIREIGSVDSCRWFWDGMVKGIGSVDSKIEDRKAEAGLGIWCHKWGVESWREDMGVSEVKEGRRGRLAQRKSVRLGFGPFN